MDKEEFKKKLKESINELALEAGLTTTLCSISLTDTDLSFQVSMTGNIPQMLAEAVDS